MPSDGTVIGACNVVPGARDKGCGRTICGFGIHETIIPFISANHESCVPVARNENFPKYKDYGFQCEELTIPELLKPAVYRSLMVGKWHLGMSVEGSHPIDAGFDKHLGIPSNFSKSRGPDHNTLFRGTKVEQKGLPFQALTSRYTDEVAAFVENPKPLSK